MALTLNKGGNLSLTKAEPGLTQVTVGLGWDVRTTAGEAFDLDASAFLVGSNGKVRSDADFVFYNQQGDVTLADGLTADPEKASVQHGGDNRTGEGDGDDETIDIYLNRVPADVDRIIIVASIHSPADATFGQIRNAYMRTVNSDNDNEIARYDLAEDYSQETALVFGEVYRKDGGWSFKAVGQGYNNGLRGVALDFDVKGLQ